LGSKDFSTFISDKKLKNYLIEEDKISLMLKAQMKKIDSGQSGGVTHISKTMLIAYIRLYLYVKILGLIKAEHTHPHPLN
jgi:hypothetical protein